MTKLNAEASIECRCEYNRTLNYAMQQNYVPVIRKLSLDNNSGNDLCDLTIIISSEPEAVYEWRKIIDVLPAGRTMDMGSVDLRLNGTTLAELSERLAASLNIAVFQGDAYLYRQTLPIDVLAFDEWGGLAALPELIGAFVTPNHPDIARVVRSAADILGQWDHNPSFDAYQSNDHNRVRKQAASIYAALQREAIAYCVAPASFEEIGQRVRLPDALFSQRMGNCLDLALAYAACLEAIGLHPLIVFTKGHAFAGAWLVNETFAESVQDDVSLLTKRLASGIHEICLVETTAAAEGRMVDFENATRAAEAHLSIADEFIGFVDIKRARASSIRPLPLRIRTPGGWELREDQAMAGTSALEEAPESLKVLERPQEVDYIPHSKQQEWERRLLDLSLRNTLLNFRATRSSIPLLTSQLGDLEDALAGNDEFQVLPRPGDWKDTPRDAELYRQIGNVHPMAPLLKEEFSQRRLRTDMTADELFNRMVNLYRSSRISLEENGANTLYLALGYLRWYETNASQKPRYAPIVLIPVELLRKTSRSGFLIRARDEEPQMNITMLEMLRQDFGIQIGGLDPLPKEEKGVDLRRVFTTIRQAVMQHPRWDVEEAGYIGLFSFSQFVMWNDIRTRAAELSRNKVVASLMAGKLKWQQPGTFPEANRLDELFHPKELAVPMSADSSQLAAVSAAGQGSSFVLHGPPGTGKSQTITNMIANALSNGKTVLFVAEKMAALTVVQRRLASIGLESFCLELHSNKSKKKAVLDQLRMSLEAGSSASPEGWLLQADRLAETRGSLNSYVEALHSKRESGMSLYEVLTLYDRVREFPGEVIFEPAFAGRLTHEELLLRTDVVKDLRAAGASCKEPYGNPWEDTGISQYSPVLKTQLAALLSAYRRQLQECEDQWKNLLKSLPLTYGERISEQEGLSLLERLCALLLEMPERPGLLLQEANMDDAIANLKKLTRHGVQRDAIRSELLQKFSRTVLEFNAREGLSLWRKAGMQWFLPRWLEQNRIVKLLRSMALPGKPIAKNSVEEMLADMIRYSEESANVKQYASWAQPRLGAALWNEGEADWEAVQVLQEWAGRLDALLLSIGGGGNQARELKLTLSRMLEAGRPAFMESYAAVLRGYAESKNRLDATERELFSLLEADAEGLGNKAAAAQSASWFAFMAVMSDRWQSRLEDIRDWCAWRRIRTRADELGLMPLIRAYEGGRMSNDRLLPSFEGAIYKAIIESIVAEDERLSSFSGMLFEEQIAKFQETNERFELLSRQEIAARLAARLPSLTSSAVQSSELGILQRAIRSGGRGMSIRKLFEQIPNLLCRLSPCMLMSPISVAQYLDPSNPLFDLVIFDEASQMPTSEAVGAMARGRDVIVVGDPKQLPPTSFFTAGSSGGSDDESIAQEDMESVLDDCLALAMPQGHLLWHYRSRHESLIAFSNMQYYENKLLTFPSPHERKSNVRLISVDGVYDRGRTKQNKAEAEAVVQEIERRLRDPLLSKRSIGVVTFNSVQQNLVEDMLDELLRKHPELESVSSASSEPIFIKNLENVQGDERDVILFSIGYGPDATGKVSLNFGPLNREGGWRRLNVAVSRARYEMLVFSTLRAEHLDVSRTSAQGVAGLKAFLEYAERGTLPLTLNSDAPERIEGLQQRIAAAIKELGYDAHVHVGCSGYRVDIAVTDPEDNGRYALGIITDGHVYQSASTARDRDLLRTAVLEQLGWSIHKVWSLDWFENPAREMKKIEQAILGALERSHSHAAPSNGSFEQESILERNSLIERGLMKETAPAVASQELQKYRICRLEPVILPAEQFHSAESTPLLLSQIRQTVEQEGPISRSLLCRRILQAWGMSRMGTKIDKRFEELLLSLQLQQTDHNGISYFWPEAADPRTYAEFRQALDEEGRRSAEDIPPEEIAAAARFVLSAQISLPKDDLVREIGKALGYQRSGPALDKAVREGIDLAVSRGYATIDGQDRAVVAG